jgi:DNA protecting protein DprA
MNIRRFLTEDFSVFKTFDAPKIPLTMKAETKDGNLALLHELPKRGFAIVGTRYPQRRSLELLETTLNDLRSTDMIILSGLARGIDSKAHELAIENGLKTIAILGCGINVQYPKENSHLRNRIIESGGIVISPYEDDEQPLPYHFLDRNQYIAAFSRATWVVEAAAVSGTLNTAKWASDFNRDLYATTCFPGDHFYQGNEKLLSERMTNRYPVAMPFFNTGSLSATWPELEMMRAEKPQLNLNLKSYADSRAKTQIQKWVLELKHEYGECHVQTLMNHASRNKLTLGEFYQKFESELGAGLLVQDQSGRVHLPV